jgi:rSAM/selenodomain-associated transferase 2
MITVIVPTLDEEEQLPRCLAALQAQGPHELIVVDAGSTDNTVRLAETGGATVLVTAPGRAAQLNEAARRASGDTLVFVHADTRLPPGALTTVRVLLGRRPEVVGGCFSLRHDSPSRLLAALTLLGNLHSRLTGSLQGDRAIFVRRPAFEAAGGFPLEPIMEDVVFGRRLKTCGRIRILHQTVISSPRHFEREGVLRVAAKAAVCYCAYDLGMSADRIATLYWSNRRRRASEHAAPPRRGSRPA